MALQLATFTDLQDCQEQTNDRLDRMEAAIKDHLNPRRAVSKKTLADILEVAESTIDGMRRQGIIDAIYVGIGGAGHPRFIIEDVFKSLEERQK